VTSGTPPAAGGETTTVRVVGRPTQPAARAIASAPTAPTAAAMRATMASDERTASGEL
jgi:hypothetical protein